MTTTDNAIVDRYRDYVAISIGDSQTYCLTQAMAERLAAAITAASEDIKERSFLKSQLRVASITPEMPVPENFEIWEDKISPGSWYWTSPDGVRSPQDYVTRNDAIKGAHAESRNPSTRYYMDPETGRVETERDWISEGRDLEELVSAFEETDERKPL